MYINEINLAISTCQSALFSIVLQHPDYQDGNLPWLNGKTSFEFSFQHLNFYLCK